jgi:hypothetical protein
MTKANDRQTTAHSGALPVTYRGAVGGGRVVRSLRNNAVKCAARFNILNKQKLILN